MPVSPPPGAGRLHAARPPGALRVSRRRSLPNALSWISVTALVILVVMLTAGAVLAWLGYRISREWEDRKATVLFFALGFVGAGVWSFLVIGALLSAVTGDPATATSGVALASALYLAAAGG
ncbi:hypothetical protein NKG05_20095 [Oerskovia sp. M15]